MYKLLLIVFMCVILSVFNAHMEVCMCECVCVCVCECVCVCVCVCVQCAHVLVCTHVFLSACNM